MLTLQDFRQADLRVGEIVAAEPISGSRRLLRLQVALAAETRTLVAGLAGHYQPRELVGLKVVLLANLEPAVIHGVRSEGMLLGAACDDAPALLTVSRPVPNGTPVQ